MMLDADLVVRRGDLDLRLALQAEPGEVVAVLGPNGAGKTTALRAVAGLVTLDEGHVTVDGQDWARPATGRFWAPERRRVGLVFSDHLLFAHLSVLQNVAFGLRARGAGRHDAAVHAQAMLDRLGVGDLGARRPATLSGGQSQRVALARALVTDPAVLLLDEPLAALDAATRTEVRHTLATHLAGWSGATVLVTHDPVDATLLADRIVVLEDGAVVQQGTGPEVARAPGTPWVAQLLGVNVARGHGDGTIVTLDGGGSIAPASCPIGRVVVTVPPQAIALHLQRPHGSPRNVWRTTVSGVTQLGPVARVRLAGSPEVLADLTTASVADLGLAPGTHVWASVKATEVTAEPEW